MWKTAVEDARALSIGCLQERHLSIQVEVQIAVEVSIDIWQLCDLWNINWLHRHFERRKVDVLSEAAMGAVEKVKEILIEEVKKVPAIWDKGHRNHHNRYHLEKQWKKISQDVGIADARARKTWKNLRQEFGKQMTKALKADCTLESLHSEWPFFQQLMFLKDQFANKKSEDDLMLPIKIEDNDDFDSRSRMDHTDVAEGMDIPTPSPAGSSRDSSPSPSPSPVPSLDTYGMSSPAPQRKRKPPTARYNTRKRRCKEESFISVSNCDEDVGFFNSLLPHVRRLTPQQKLLFRMKLQQYLYDLSYGYSNGRQNMLYEPSNLPNLAMFQPPVLTQNSMYQSPNHSIPSPAVNHIASRKQGATENSLSQSPQPLSSRNEHS